MTDTIALPGASTPEKDAAHKRHILLIFAGLMVTMLLASLDQTIFSTALPTIVGDLHGVDQQLWVTTAYILASTITLPVYGKLGDLIGRELRTSESERHRHQPVVRRPSPSLPLIPPPNTA